MSGEDPIAAEVRSAFEEYEPALCDNDAEALDRFFLHRADIVRFGVAEVQYGIEAIRQFRASQNAFTRRLERTTIAVFGAEVAVVSTMFYRDDTPGYVGRQQQTWLRTADGWRIGAAHVSMTAQSAS